MPAPSPTPAPAPAAPAKVRLYWPYGFIDENGRNRFWKAGEVISDATEIALLTAHKAPIEPA